MSQSDPEVSFAFWIDPVTAVKISYSLPLFNEIDFEVNEGYRRIPHGGVEVGGLLYGRIGPKLTDRRGVSVPSVVSMLPGPPFSSPKSDLANLQEAILTAPNDQELQGLEPVGWFIAHTRGPLRMTDREAELFRRFFPEPKRVTVLVKPERFKPTRFAFLIRSTAGIGQS